LISLEEFEEQWLEEILEGSPSSIQKGQRFAEKLLRDWHEIDAATAEVVLCDGAGDGGIDAAVFVKSDPEEGIEGDTWILIQSKYGTAYASVDTIGMEAQKLFATLEGKREGLSGLSTELVARLRNFIANMGTKDSLEYVLATNRTLSADDLEFLANVRTLGRAKFGNGFDTDAISIETIYKKLDEGGPAQKAEITLKTNVSKSGDFYIGSTGLIDLFEFMRNYKNRTGDLDLIYEKNVRKFLGNKKKVNKGIEKTLNEHPERFGLYNNGITIVAEGAVEDGTGALKLIEPFIVNGCQTTRSIWAVLQARLNSGGSAKSPSQESWEAQLAKAVVVTKIVVVGPEGESLLTETTRFTNMQNAVGEKDFLALEKDFRAWTPIFNSKYGVFLEIQRGAWEARRAFQRQNPSIKPRYEEAANAFELLKAYAAGWLNEPGIAYGKNPPFAPGGSLFNKILNTPDFGVESLYAAYLVQRLANEFKFGRGAKMPTRGQTRYLFIMIAVDMVRDLLVNFGSGYSAPEISRAIICLDRAGCLMEIGGASVQLIDEYLTFGNEDSLFTEPEFEKSQDLNAFLKSEKLGKSYEFAPKLKMQMAITRRSYRKSNDLQDLKKILAACEPDAE